MGYVWTRTARNVRLYGSSLVHASYRDVSTGCVRGMVMVACDGLLYNSVDGYARYTKRKVNCVACVAAT